MITVYRRGGKPFNDNNSIIIITESLDSFKPEAAICGGCNAKGALVFYCKYTRGLDILKNGVPNSQEITLDRYKCGICGKTHVIAPGELIIPYTRHSLEFIIIVIEAYIKREKPIRQIAIDFQIVVSTLYKWLKVFRNHFELLVGKLEAAAGDIGEHIETVLKDDDISQRLFDFVETHLLCFLQTITANETPRFFTLRGFLIFTYFPRGASP